MMLTHEQRIESSAKGIATAMQIDFEKNKPALISYAETAVAAYLAGDVVVPREPTRDMTMNACDRLPSCEHVFGYAGEICASVYRAMIDRQHISWPISDFTSQRALTEAEIKNAQASNFLELSSMTLKNRP
jgi:hypothetical protein